MSLQSRANLSVRPSDDEAAAVAVAPRVSLADIEASERKLARGIGAEYHFLASEGVKPEQPCSAKSQGDLRGPELALLSLCVLVMRNGFTVVGKSAPASAANFDQDLGRKLAREDAIRQVWPLEGYQLSGGLPLRRTAIVERSRSPDFEGVVG